MELAPAITSNTDGGILQTHAGANDDYLVTTRSYQTRDHPTTPPHATYPMGQPTPTPAMMQPVFMQELWMTSSQ